MLVYSISEITNLIVEIRKELDQLEGADSKG